MSKPKNYWTLKTVMQESKNFTTRKEWRLKSASSYIIANRNKWFNKCCKHMKNNGYIKNRWTNKMLLESAKKYNYRSTWKRNDPTAYNTACNRNMLKKCCQHMKYIGNLKKRLVYAYEFDDNSVYIGLTFNEESRKYDHLQNKQRKNNSPVYKHMIKNCKTLSNITYLKITNGYINADMAQKIEHNTIKKYKKLGWNILNKNQAGALGANNMKWTKTKCIKDAKKYNTIISWRKNSGAYQVAFKNKWLKICCKHMTRLLKPKGYWTYKRCLSVAKKCKTRNEFQITYGRAYTISRKNNWLKQCYAHMNEIKKPNGYWSKERCLQEAKKYSSKSLFKKKSSYVYSVCIKNKWI